MSETRDRAQGACFCGAIRFRVRLPSAFCGHCHCSMCRRAHGAGFVTWFAVTQDCFELESGDAELTRFASSEHGIRSFCARCGSSLFCESAHHPNLIDIVLANMEGPIDREPQAHYYYDCRASWVEARDELQKLGGETGTQPL